MLSYRQQLILHQLIYAKNYVRVDELGKQFGISARTVRHDLLQMEDWLKKYDIKLTRHRKQGVKLPLPQNQLQMLLDDLQQRPDYLPNKEREYLLSKQLLEKSKLKWQSVLEDLSISKNTLLIDLANVREWFADRELELVREDGWIKVLGSELHKRGAYLELLKSEIKNEHILHYVLGENVGNVFFQSWKKWLLPQDVQHLFNVIARLEQRLRIEFSDDAYSALILHLLMAMERLKHHHVIRMDSRLLQELKKTKEFTEVRTVLQEPLETYFNIAIPAEEIGYITQHVLGAQREMEGHERETVYRSLAEQMVTTVEEKLGYALLLREQVMNGLAIHLKPAMYRAKYDLQIQNPLAEQLETELASHLVTITEVVHEVMRPYGIEFTKGEIGYIAMHIGSGIHPRVHQRKIRVALVCSSGLGTAAMLRQKVSAIYPQIDIVGHYSYIQLKELTAAHADYILSTIDIGYTTAAPWLKVSPFMTLSDQTNINRALGIIQRPELAEIEAVKTVQDVIHIVNEHASIHDMDKLTRALLALFQGSGFRPTNDTLSLSELLPVNSIILQQEPMPFEKALSVGNRPLIERGIVDEQYEKRLTEIVKSGNHHFIIKEGVAFPHVSMQNIVKGTGFSLVTFKHPILFGSSRPSIWLMITLAAEDQYRHIGAMGTLFEVLNDAYMMKTLHISDNREKVWHLVREKEQQMA